MKILVTGAGALLGQGIIRALRASTLEAHIVAVDPNPLAVGLYWADTRHLVPMATEPDYIDRVRQILARETPDALLVGTDAELSVLARHRNALEQSYGTKILVSDPCVIAVADDKYATSRFLRDNGFDPPACCLPADVEELIRRVGFPLIVKPRVGARSVGVRLVQERAQLEQALEEGADVVVQEYAGTPEHEYTAGVACFDGRCRASITLRRDLRDGNTYRAYVEHYPRLNSVVQRMAETLQPYGPANFQFRLDGERVRCFEINARFSGTAPLRALAGFNDVEMCIRRILYGEPVTQPQIEPLVLLRYGSEVVLRPEQILGSNHSDSTGSRDAQRCAPAVPVRQPRAA